MSKKLIIITLALITILYGCQQDDVSKAEADVENEPVEENSDEQIESNDEDTQAKEAKPIHLDRNGGINRLFNRMDQFEITQEYYLEHITFELSKYEIAVLSAGQAEPEIITSFGDTDVVLMGVRKEIGYSTGEEELVIDVGLAHTFKEEGGTLLTDHAIAENINPRSPAEMRIRNGEGNRPQYIGRSSGGEHEEIPEERFSWHLKYEEVQENDTWQFKLVGLKELNYQEK
ncbi:hypothetical protein [Aquisalibacillus elongatus]|uniref:Lipoprotein n=1 Tax=Aquisalibacillus elongatus TaxID=485577 RepID=A0A3N5BVU3_9BACI|nr:hypothetical protein [Aquisalibacillus elongatus]RPF53918.1 hypothetical protein EDC24_1103 [Aquisalibacillus elongatus]